jgi:hypothetical protein
MSHLTKPQDATSQKTAFFIVTAVKTSRLPSCFINEDVIYSGDSSSSFRPAVLKNNMVQPNGLQPSQIARLASTYSIYSYSACCSYLRNIIRLCLMSDRRSGLVVRVPGSRTEVPGSIPGPAKFSER